MVCNRCGTQNSEGGKYCQNCGELLVGGNQTGIKTLFSDLTNHRTQGAIALLAVFIGLCVSSVFSILALALRESVKDVGTDGNALISLSTTTWIFLLLFQLAMIVLIIFKQDLINVIVSSIGVEGLCTVLLFALINKWMDVINDGPQGLVIAFMVILILGAIAKIVFVFINSFMTQHFETPLFIISIAYSGAALVFSVTVFLVAMLNEEGEAGEYFNRFCGVGFGFASYCLALCGAAIISVFLYRGLLTKSKFSLGTLYHTSGSQTPGINAVPAGNAAMVQPAVIECIAGVNRGMKYSINGEIIIGAGQGSVSILETGSGVSRQHCRIRFEQSQNCYYVMDLSTNGTFVNNQRIQQGVYVACGRGSIVILADQGKQYQLL